MCNENIRYIESPFYCGGIVVSPVLVWSRLYSLGKGQLFQGIYIVGEKNWTGSQKDGLYPGFPELEGIWMGNGTAHAVSDNREI